MYNKTNYNILIVDDQKANIDVLSKILKDDYAISAAKSGKAALQRARADRPDLILLDVIMPDMDGFQVISQLKEDESTSEIPVVFITGLDDYSIEEKGIFLGAAAYIVKPFSSIIIKSIIRTQLTIVQQKHALEQLAMLDPLTGIANRQCFQARLKAEWNRSSREKLPLGFFMVGLDNYRNYNSSYGYIEGDRLLQIIAQQTNNTAKRPSDLLARLGGDHFGALLPNTDLNGALTIAEEVRAAIEAIGKRAAAASAAEGATPTPVTASIGVVAEVAARGGLEEDFVARAEKLMNTAKTTGRNKVCSG